MNSQPVSLALQRQVFVSTNESLQPISHLKQLLLVQWRSRHAAARFPVLTAVHTRNAEFERRQQSIDFVQAAAAEQGNRAIELHRQR